MISSSETCHLSRADHEPNILADSMQHRARAASCLPHTHAGTGQDEASREEDDKRANTTFDKVEERLQAIAAAAALRTKQEEEERKMARRSRSSSALKY